MSFLPLVVNLSYGLLYSRFVRFVSDLGSGNNFVSPPLFLPLFFFSNPFSFLVFPSVVFKSGFAS